MSYDLNSDEFFLDALNEIRKNYANNPVENFKAAKPHWVTYKTLNSIYDYIPTLAQKGRIVYGCLVMANEDIFKLNHEEALPAVIIYSDDSYYDNNINELREIAINIFSYKNKKGLDGELRDLSDKISSDYEYFYGEKIPGSIAPNGNVYMSTTMIFREHLPKGFLNSSLFPIFIDPSNMKYSMIVPKEYLGPLFLSYEEYLLSKKRPFLDQQLAIKRKLGALTKYGIPIVVVVFLTFAVLGTLYVELYSGNAPIWFTVLFYLFLVLFVVGGSSYFIYYKSLLRKLR